MAPKDNINRDQFDPEQLTLFNEADPEQGFHASATEIKDSLMAWLKDKEKGRGKVPWSPGWNRDT